MSDDKVNDSHFPPPTACGVSTMRMIQRLIERRVHIQLAVYPTLDCSRLKQGFVFPDVVVPVELEKDPK